MVGKRKKPQATLTSKSKKTTRCNKNIQLHQDSEPEEEEQEEAKEESQEEEAQEEEAVDNEDDDSSDDDDDKEDSNNEDTTKLPSQGNKKTKRTRRSKPRGLGYTQEETETLLSCIHEVIPIGPQDWENVLHKNNQHFPDTARDVPSIRRKYNKLQSTRIPTGDPNCPPPHVRQAKRIHREIEEKMDAQAELEEEELGFPSSDVEDEVAAATTATTTVATPTTAVAVGENSPALFRRPKKARPDQQQGGVSNKVDGLLSVLVTKMVQDQDRAEEQRLERQQQREEMRLEREDQERRRHDESRRNDMMTMMMMTMMSAMVPTHLQGQMSQMMNEQTTATTTTTTTTNEDEQDKEDNEQVEVEDNNKN